MTEYLWFLARVATVVVVLGVLAFWLVGRPIASARRASSAGETGAWRLRPLHSERRRLVAALRESLEKEASAEPEDWLARCARWLPLRRARDRVAQGATDGLSPSAATATPRADVASADSGPTAEGVDQTARSGAQDAAGALGPARRFVLDFHGDVQASAVGRLAREVSTLISLAQPGDEVLVRLESTGGVVHGYGLGAAELRRLKDAGLRVVVAVDRVAASGGYLMACVADEIVASPFAIVGSIGVVAQLPNFHRWLDARAIDYELLTAGEHKRTLTVFGKNTPAGRAKMQADLDDTHALFKAFVAEARPQLDIDRVADGSYWYGERALALGLVDRLATSEALLHEWTAVGPVFHLERRSRKSLAERLQEAFGAGLRVWRGARAEAATPAAGEDRWLR